MISILHIHSEVSSFSISSIPHILLESISDTLKTLPFLFIAFLIIEFLEHKAEDKIQHLFTHSRSAGPLIGTVLGCIPQCGFSSSPGDFSDISIS